MSIGQQSSTMGLHAGRDCNNFGWRHGKHWSQSEEGARNLKNLNWKLLRLQVVLPLIGYFFGETVKVHQNFLLVMMTDDWYWRTNCRQESKTWMWFTCDVILSRLKILYRHYFNVVSKLPQEIHWVGFWVAVFGVSCKWFRLCKYVIGENCIQKSNFLSYFREKKQEYYDIPFVNHIKTHTDEVLHLFWLVLRLDRLFLIVFVSQSSLEQNLWKKNKILSIFCTIFLATDSFRLLCGRLNRLFMCRRYPLDALSFFLV